MPKSKQKSPAPQRWVEDRRFRALIESSPDGIALLDAEVRPVYVSPAITRILGYTRDEIMGTRSFGLAHPDDLRPTQLVFADLVRQPGSSVQALIRLRHKNGLWRWIEVWGRNLLHEPEIAAIVVNYRDVTERKEADENSRDIERRMCLAMEGGRMGAWEADLQTGTVRWFLRSETHFGLPEGSSSWPLDKFFQLLHPDDRERIREEFFQCIARRINHESEFRVVWPDGSVHWLFGLGQPIADASGRVVRIYGVGRDITARKQTEEALRESEGRATGMLNAITESIMMIDLEGSILAVNSTMARRLGSTVDELRGRNVYELLPPEVAQGRRARAEEVIRSGKSIRFQDPRGASVLDSHVYPLRDAGGKVTGLVVFAVDITERKRADAALKEMQRRMAFVLAATPAVIYTADFQPPYPWTFISETIRQQLGYEPTDCLAEADFWQRNIHPEDRGRVLGDLAGLTERKECLLEYRFRHRDGTWRWLRDESRLLPNPDGLGNQVVGLAVDVTEHKQAAEALRDQEARLRLTLDAARFGAWEVDLLTGKVTWSELAEAQFGLAPGTFEGTQEAFFRKIHPDHQREVREKFHRAIQEGADYEVELRCVWPDGSIHWNTSLGRAFRDQNGQPVRLVGVSRDITARKEAEQSLRQTEERYRSIVETAEEGIWLVDRDWRITFVNRRLTQMLGYSEEELVGRQITDLMDEAERRAAPEHMHLRERGERSTHDSRLRRKDGSTLWAIVAGNPLMDDAGRFAGALAMIADITERKEAEVKLRESAEALEALSRRLLAVQETERQALARELHDEVGQSLTLLKLAVDRCRQVDPAEVPARLEEAQAMLGDLVRRVRNMSLDLRPSMLDDLGLLPALLWQFDRYRSQTRIEVLFTQSGLEGRRLGPHVETAAFRIVQEALTNTARHAGVRRVSVHVGAENDLLKVQVQDDGQGFDVKAVLEADVSFGLRGMFERARLLGGRLQINSDPGAGTFLTAELPLRTPGLPPDAGPTASASTPPHGSPP